MEDGEFSSPTGIAVDKDGNLYVADTDNHSIQKFDKEGKFLGALGRRSRARRKAASIIRAGWRPVRTAHVYVADSGNNRVQKSGYATATPCKSWGKFGFAWRGADMGKFDVPWGVTTDQEGNIYVSDTSNARIQKFKARRHASR